MMEKLNIDDEKTKEIFITAFREKNLVPILGAGFTSGLKTKNGEVPNGKILKKYMIEEVLKVQKGITYDELDHESFSTVAELFEKSANKSTVSKYFKENFMYIKMNRTNQLLFLNKIDWSYIYTLNIDTGIEDSESKLWEVFYPNRNFDERQDFDGRRKLFKIHGDVNNFIKSLNYDEMILTESQYIQSLSSNKKFHDMLSADCENKNLLYIGCSLDDEIDIKYSVLSDTNRNFRENETYRIYVTADLLSELKKAKLEGYNISHYIQLQSDDDYELFYEFLFRCYEESVKDRKDNIENLRYKKPQIIGKNIDENIDYLSDIGVKKQKIPYYYFESELLKSFQFSREKINIIIGRRFVGKTMLAYNILEYFQKYQRYFINEQESIDRNAIQELLNLSNALIVFDSDSVDDSSFLEILKYFKSEKGSIVCIFINSYDDIVNLISYHLDMVNFLNEKYLVGRLSENDIVKINTKLNDIGIAMFDGKKNILDNTLRISNLYNKSGVSEYSISSKEEIEIIIWILVQNRMYYEEIVSLGLSKSFRNIVGKFDPFLQIERCKSTELRKHSAIKIVCNGKLGLLQILNNYVYPQENEIGTYIVKKRHDDICDSIYQILFAFHKIDKNILKKFIMFDTLNDIFSRKYSKRNIEYLVSDGKEGKQSFGAAGLIEKIYNDSKIQQLKSMDPNYWLQRAKSAYISAYTKKSDLKKLYDGIKWAKKAEQDSRILVTKGENQYYRTISNATIQIAIMYGRVAKINKYSNQEDNIQAVSFYYQGLSDQNNVAAAKSLIKNSKGTEDFNALIYDIIENPEHYDPDTEKERQYLINIKLTGKFMYSS